MDRLYVVAFPVLRAEDANHLEALRASHDAAGHARLKAHFTFVFGCAHTLYTAAEDAMRSAAATLDPIAFHLSQVVCSEHGGFHYVFLCPGPGAVAMRALHERLHAGPLAACLDPREPFTPHLTVCKTTQPAQAQEVFRRLNAKPPRIDGTLRVLSLGAVRDDRFVVLSEAPLRGGR